VDHSLSSRHIAISALSSAGKLPRSLGCVPYQALLKQHKLKITVSKRALFPSIVRAPMAAAHIGTLHARYAFHENGDIDPSFFYFAMSKDAIVFIRIITVDAYFAIPWQLDLILRQMTT